MNSDLIRYLSIVIRKEVKLALSNNAVEKRMKNIDVLSIAINKLACNVYDLFSVYGLLSSNKCISLELKHAFIETRAKHYCNDMHGIAIEYDFTFDTYFIKFKSKSFDTHGYYKRENGYYTIAVSITEFGFMIDDSLLFS